MYLHLWKVFHELCASRQFNNGNPQPLTYTEINSYCSLFGERLSRFDLAALRRLDTAWIDAASAAARR